MENEPVTIYSGDEVWKNYLEYHGEKISFYGNPYHRITKEDNIYYLWELDLDDPDSRKYKIIKQYDDFNLAYEEGMALMEKYSNIYRSLELYRDYGKVLIKKLKDALQKEANQESSSLSIRPMVV